MKWFKLNKDIVEAGNVYKMKDVYRMGDRTILD